MSTISPKPARAPDRGPSATAPLFGAMRSLVLSASNRTLKMVIYCLAAVVVIEGIAVAALGVVVSRNPTAAIGIRDDLSVIPLTPLSDTDLFTNARIVAWAAKAIVAPWNFDYVHYRQQITSQLNEYFTQDGAAQLKRELVNQGLINLIEKRKYVVSMVPKSTPTLVAGPKLIGGVMMWKLVAPVSVTYRGIDDTRYTDYSVTIIVRRVHGDGDKMVAIDQYIMSPATTQ